MDQHDLNDIAHRIASAAAQFGPGYRPTGAQKADAASVLRDMIQAAETHGVTFADFDGVADFPRLAIQLVQTRDASR
ncbi:hypothetical protein K4B79_43520 [Streptomyces lincolnensis]|uniref:hypothetical protein n=1 Tax=Streptomyces lincolnensis TaxID=1915 RepID=UPI001E5D5E85|nr:hypothetical protein [Streptomyces lincolnensis]MCD7445048.1 hypothetical protein [Streptomyces lincolnensis]